MSTKTKSTAKTKKPAAKAAKKKEPVNPQKGVAKGDYFYSGRNKKFDGKRLAKDILAKREKDNLSFGAIEIETGIPKSAVFQVEAGNREHDLSLNLLVSLCNWLDVPIQHYFK